MEYNRQWTTMKNIPKNDSNEKSKRRIKWWGWLAVAVAVAGAAALLILAIVKLNSGKAFPYEGDYPNAVTVELVDDEGIPYTVDAIEGQICVWFDGDVSYRKAKMCHIAPTPTHNSAMTFAVSASPWSVDKECLKLKNNRFENILFE